MAEWIYQREENTQDKIEVGEHRLRIASVDKAMSKNGKDMLIIKFDVSKHNLKIWHYIVFLPDNPQITNRNLTQLFDSFGIDPKDANNTQSWIGKTGACMTKAEEYNGTESIKVRYFIDKRKQDKLPAWVEGTGVAKATSVDKLQPADISDDDMPF